METRKVIDAVAYAGVIVLLGVLMMAIWPLYLLARLRGKE